jgi:uncharacterized protein
MFKNRAFIYAIASLVFFAIMGSLTLVNLYTDWLFFKQLDYASVFTKILSAQVILGFLFGLIGLAFILANVLIANRAVFPVMEDLYIDQTHIALNFEKVSMWMKPVALLSGLLAGLLCGVLGSNLWKEVLVYQNRMSMNLSDPIFNKDVGFYLYQLPMFEAVKGMAAFMIFAAIVIVSASYFFRGGISSRESKLFIDGRVKKHLGILSVLYLLTVAAGFYFDRFNILLSPHGVIFGAGYTDIHARLIALQALAGLTLLSAVFFAAGIFRNSWKMAVYPLLLTAGVYGVGVIAYPSLLQSLKVTPNEIVLEKEYIEHNIKFTRFGYDLDSIELRPFNVSYDLTAKDIDNNDTTIRNIRLWDDAPLLRTYSQLQQIRTYYKFFDVDNDRYVIDGKYMQVMLSPRELSYADLPSKSWINERMVFTHGFGIAVGPVSRISREGLPEFIVKDIPPVSSSQDLKVTVPEIYFGELSNDYVIVKTRVPEFNYPTSEGNVSTSYSGEGGVGLSSFLRKAFFSLRFQTAKPVLSSDITPESRILYYRNVLERARRIAPFLSFDPDPYMVISEDGRLFWIIDAYTVSDRVPYSKPVNRTVNYMRNSVKTLVDAYNGTVDFYISDPDDVMIKVYSAAFPGLFKPLSGMREDLRKHIRYPKGFLQVQASMFSTYHMTDPKVFYNKEDLWEIPVYGERYIEPYYTIMKLPGENREEYILLLPYTPSKRDNLAAWIAARCDEPYYGKLIAYTFPRDRLVFGPKQVNARIDQDSYISQQLTLWGQRGSDVIRGSLLVIPIENSLLYVQPLYLAAQDKGGLPELRRVILAYENTVVMEENLELGLRQLFGAKAPSAVREKIGEDVGSSLTELSREAARIFDRALELQRQGDWAGYGQQIRNLEQILKRMSK